MVTFVYESDQVSVPEWVTDLASFRRWARSDEFPETGRISVRRARATIARTSDAQPANPDPR